MRTTTLETNIDGKLTTNAIARIREWYDNLKEQPCEDCDKKFDPVCMQWDHRGTDKLMAVGTLAHRENKTLILAELPNAISSVQIAMLCGQRLAVNLIRLRIENRFRIC